MPGLYANVNVGNTVGLYQQNAGTSQVLTSAQSLLSLLSNAGTVGFSLTSANTQVQASVDDSGVSAGTYGNVTYYPVITVGVDGRVTSVTVNSVTAATGNYGNANVAAYLNGQVTIGNLTVVSGIYWANGQPYSSGSGTIYGNANVVALLGNFGSNSISTTGNVTAGNVLSNNYLYANGVSILTGVTGNYSNTNVAAYLTTATISTTGNITAANLTTAGNVTASYVKGNGSLLTNLPTQAGTYSNTNVTAYLTTATISTTGNITAANLTTAGNVSANYVIGNGSLLTNLPTQAGTYSNTNVAAYLTTATISTTGNVTAANLITAGNVSGSYLLGNGSKLTALTGASAGVYGSDTTIPSINVDATGRIISITTNAISGGGSYGNANVAAYLPIYSGNLGGTLTTATQSYISNIAGAAATTTIGYKASISAGANQTVIGSQQGIYLNAAIATDGTVGAQAFLNTTGQFVTQSQITGNITSTNGYFWSNGTAYSTGITGTYSNTNVAAYLTTATITTTGNITAGNLIATNYVQGDGSKLTNLPTQAGTYSNANVASYMPVFGGNILAGNVNIPYTSGSRNRGPLAVGGNISQYDTGVIASFIGNEATYLYTSLQNSNSGNTAYSSYALNDDTHTYYGELGINSSTYDYAAAGYPNNAFSKPLATFLQSTGANLAIGTYGNYGVNFVVNGGTVAADAMTIANSGNVTVTGNLAVGTLATVGNIASTNGYFWANGTPYSTGGGGGSSFTGNLAGNTLFDSVNRRIVMQANNLSAVSYPTGSFLNVNFFAPNALSFYGNGVVSPATGSGVATYIASANVTVGTRGGTNWSPTGQYNLSQIYPDPNVTSMANQDRLRGVANTTELYPSGKNWGTFYTPSAANASTAANLTTVVAMNGLLSTVGTGYLSHGIAVGATNQLNPVSGSANMFMQTGTYSSIGWNSGTAVTAGRTASNIGYARLFGGVVNGGSQQANLTITNCVGLHITNAWAPGGIGGIDTITNRYAVLNEDAGTKIQTNGNLVVTGNTQIQALQETVSATGSTGGAITINASLGTIQTLTLTSSISSLSFTNLPTGGTVTLIITQGGSGSYTLTTTGIKYAGGSSTLSTAVGAIDMLNILYDGTNYYGSLVKGYA
jgi:hypothetical protein